MDIDKIVDMIEHYVDLSRNYALISKEKDKTKQKNYLSNINYSIKKIKEIVPERFKKN